MLAIHDTPEVMEPFYANIKNKKKQEEFLHQWMTEELGITASFPATLWTSNSDKNIHPSKYLYKDIPNTKEQDFFWCLQKLQYNKYSAFCMQKRHV